MERVKRKERERSSKEQGGDLRKGNKVRLLLDSGAFGAWSRGEELDLKKYIRYCKDNAPYIWTAINLDKIPGSFGRRDNSQEEVEVSAKQSYKNLQTMKDAGVNAVPVFHQGERIAWLEKYLKDGEPYIGLSASKFVRVDEQQRWLDMVFNILCTRGGIPTVRTHGFALTSFPLLTSYPWYTVDSTTWSLTPGYGQIIIPAWENGQWNYLAEPTRIAISGVTHKSVSSQMKQFENLGPLKKEVVTRYLEDVVGTDISMARYGTNERRKCMLIYYIHLCEALRDVRFKGARASIFGHAHLNLSKREALEPFNLILTFATSLNREWSELMTAVGANSRLLSYWEMKGRSNDILQEYVTTGTHGVYERNPIRQDWSETYKNRRRLALLARIKAYNDMATEEIQLDDTTAAEAEQAASGLRS